MDMTEKTVKENPVYRGRIITVRCDDALRPDGKPCKRELVVHPGGACVLYVRDGRILLVKQFRYAYKKELYEIPAGKLEAGEDPALAASRELEEEAGVRAASLSPMLTLYPSPGYTDEKIYIYFAEDGKETAAHPDDGEFLSAEYLPEEKVRQMLDRGEFNDAKTIVALQAYFLRKAERLAEDARPKKQVRRKGCKNAE